MRWTNRAGALRRRWNLSQPYGVIEVPFGSPGNGTLVAPDIAGLKWARRADLKVALTAVVATCRLLARRRSAGDRS